MRSVLTYVGAAILVGHGMVHFLGTAVYLEVADVAGFPYKTTLLASTVNVGDTGMRVFGLLWAVAAIGFVAAASAVVTGWDHWPLVVGAVTVFSLILTTLDYTVAYAGIVVNLGILVGVSYVQFT